MSKKHHGQQVGSQEPEVKNVASSEELLKEAAKEQDAQNVAELEAVAEEVEVAEEKKENPSSFKARMKALKEQQKKEMAALKEDVQKEREKAKAEGKIGKGSSTPISRNTITAKVISEIDGPVKFDDLAIRCDEAYVAANTEGHKSNVREARTVLRNNLIVAPIFSNGAIKVEGDVISRTATA